MYDALPTLHDISLRLPIQGNYRHADIALIKNPPDAGSMKQEQALFGNRHKEEP